MPLPFIRKRKKGSSIEKERLNNGSYSVVSIECYDTDTEMREKLGNGNYAVISISLE